MADVADRRESDLVEEHRLRLPELDVLTELAEPRMGFPVPGMAVGFPFVLEGEELEVESRSRIAGGSGQRHRISPEGCVLVAEGFV